MNFNKKLVRVNVVYRHKNDLCQCSISDVSIQVTGLDDAIDKGSDIYQN